MERGKNLLKYISVLFFSSALLVSTASAQGKIEFGFHYSYWSVNIIRGIIEDVIGDTLESNLEDDFLSDIQDDYPYLEKESYEQDVSFDSSGDNFGFEMRWYPGGYNGSFSLGLSIEKTTMRLALTEVYARMDLTSNSYFDADASGEYIIKPLSFHLSFRWDLFPSFRIRPYFTFGFGAATGTALKESELSYSYSGELEIEGEIVESYSESETKTLEEIRQELEDEGEDFFLPGFIPFFQMNLGLKAEITKNLHLLFDAGVWDGFLLRGGIAVRL
ncbi:MAG: hypothetical protein R6V00_05505 [Candidatus Aminicenantes bacterium]